MPLPEATDEIGKTSNIMLLMLCHIMIMQISVVKVKLIKLQMHGLDYSFLDKILLKNRRKLVWSTTGGVLHSDIKSELFSLELDRRY